MFHRVNYLVWASREESLESALVVLHFLWSESLCNKGMGEARHANPSRIDTENVTDACVRLVCALGRRSIATCDYFSLSPVSVATQSCPGSSVSAMRTSSPLLQIPGEHLWAHSVGFEKEGCGGAFLLGGSQSEKFIL